MSRVLLCTILRNAEATLDRYHAQIKAVAEAMPHHEFYLSLFENDSQDRTVEMMNAYDWSFLAGTSIKSETFGYRQYGSVVDADRVEKLAFYRNRAIDDCGFFDKAEKLAFIESDMTYTPEVATKIIDHENDIEHIDVYSPVSITVVPYHTNMVPITHNGRSDYRCYDTWATRRSQVEEWGDILPNWREHPIAPFWSTMNGFCLYNVEPFKKGVRYSGWNKRLGKHDCDTVVICENFREAGYGRVFINQSLYCVH